MSYIQVSIDFLSVTRLFEENTIRLNTFVALNIFYNPKENFQFNIAYMVEKTAKQYGYPSDWRIEKTISYLTDGIE